MSSDSATGVPTFSPSPEEFVSLVKLGYYENCVASVGLAWLVYDYFLTLPLEISSIWNSKPSATTIMFLLNRYLSIAGWVAVCFESLYLIENLESHLCRVFYSLDGIFYFIVFFSATMIMLLRTYAICGRNRILILFAAAVCLCSISFQIWYIVPEIKEVGIVIFPKIDHIGNCASLAPPTPTCGYMVASIVSPVIQSVVFIVTFLRTAFVFRQARAAGVKAELAALLLRDGSLYFLILSITNLLSLIALFLWSVNLPPFIIAFGNLNKPLEAILVNRLVLNLRSLDRSMVVSRPSDIKTDIFFRQAYGTHRDPTGSLAATILGNIGEPLRVDDEEDLFEEDTAEKTEELGEVAEGFGEALSEIDTPVGSEDEPPSIRQSTDV